MVNEVEIEGVEAPESEEDVVQSVADGSPVWPESEGDAAAPEPELVPELETGEAEKPAEGDEPEGEGTPEGTEEPAAPEPEPAKVEPEPKPAWDKDRQLRDLTRAHQKALERLSALETQVAESASRQDKTPAPAPPPDEIDLLDPETATAAEYTKAIKTVNARIARLQADREADRKRAEQDAAALAAERESVREEQLKADVLAHLADMDKTYGAEFRNKAVKSSQDYFRARGFSKDNPPDWLAVKPKLELEYMRLSTGKKAKTTPKPKKESETPTPDSGAGGSATTTAKAGTMDEVIADMKQRGKW